MKLRKRARSFDSLIYEGRRSQYKGSYKEPDDIDFELEDSEPDYGEDEDDDDEDFGGMCGTLVFLWENPK